ncbi:imm11 family protein [Croceivirga radicis]|uniref:imm11 family protein n=1 Tax=Croceivirga radicis TaxID=1929488 RepID=UPI000255AC13|nr:DUF1629 domain-containing protein [Croceivirga radicis]
MKYYTLGVSVDLEIIGTYPQIEKENDYNLADPHSYWNVTWDKIPDFNPIYKIKLKHRAKPTSVLSSLSGFCGLTVNEELKRFLERFNLPEHKFYPIQVYHGNKDLNYYWFHFVNSFLSYLDFSNTIFELYRKSKFEVLEQFTISSVEELHKKEDELNFEKGIRLKKIVLKDNFPNYDIIRLSNIAPIFLASENLKVELEKSRLTGFVFNEYKPLTTSQTPT